MKKIEKLALAASLACVIRPLGTFLFISWTADLFRSAEKGVALSSLESAGGYVASISMLAVSAVSGIWLYTEAKRERHTKCVWAFFGLVFQLKGVAIFYIWTLLQEFRSRDTTSEHQAGTDG